MLHPKAQRSEHRTKTLASTTALLSQKPAMPNFSNQAASKALSPGTTRVLPPVGTSTLHLDNKFVKNLNPLSGLVGEDQIKEQESLDLRRLLQ